MPFIASLRVRAIVLGLAAAVAVTACSGPVDAEPEPPEQVVVEPPAPEPVVEPEPEPEPVLTDAAPLTGVLIESGHAAELEQRPLLLVKVDNGPTARPQAGLDLADVVFEELVEGGVTRFVALFHSQLPERVGPVRSARFVDVDLGSGFGRPVFANSGARQEVRARLQNSPLVSFIEGQASGFERDRSRRAPNNLMLRPAGVLSAGRDRGAQPPAGDALWTFDRYTPFGYLLCGVDVEGCVRSGDEITVAMSRRSRTGWRYEAESGLYRRIQDGQDFTVTGDGRVGAANVVVLATRHYSSGCCDTSGSPYADTEVTGSGRAVILRDGRWYEATWQKSSSAGPLLLLGDDGKPFPLKPGPTWVLLPPARAIPNPAGR